VCCVKCPRLARLARLEWWESVGEGGRGAELGDDVYKRGDGWRTNPSACAGTSWSSARRCVGASAFCCVLRAADEMHNANVNDDMLRDDLRMIRTELEILDKMRCDYSALFDRKADLEKMTTQLEQIDAGLPEALCVCNEVFKAELVEVTAQLSKFGPSRVGPIPLDPDSDWRRPMPVCLEIKVLVWGYVALFVYNMMCLIA
jgi:hypothetical protein